MRQLIDMERKGCESSIHDHDIDFSMAMVGWVDVPDRIIKLCCYVIRSTRSPGLTALLFLSGDVKNTKFNQYLPVDLTSLNVSNSRFRKPVMF